MATLYLPQSVQHEIETDRAEIAMQYMELRGLLDHWNRELQRIDPRLRMVKAHDRVASDSPLKAGYYHVILDAPGHPSTVLPLEYENGEYREPGSWVFEFMERNDMWNDRAIRASRNRQQRIREAAERQKDRERQERVDHYNERWASANRTQILVKRSIGGE